MQLVFEQIRTGGDRNLGYLLGDRDAQAAVPIDRSRITCRAGGTGRGTA